MVEEMQDNDLAQELEVVAGDWEQGKSQARKDQPVGTFQVEITSASIGRSQSSDRLQIAYEMVIIAGPSKDVVLRKYDGMGDAQQMSIAQSSLRALGVDTKKHGIKELPAVLLTLKGKQVAVTTKQNGDFFNVYFKRTVVKKQTSSTAGAPPAGTKGVPTKGKF